MFAIRTLSRKCSLPLLSLQYPGEQSYRYNTTNADELEYLSTSTNHNDLPTFLEHAARHDLDPKSMVYLGTHYEYTVQAALERCGMSLKRIGGKSDCGIDIFGTWSSPSVPEPLKVIIQCKGHVRKREPKEIRELEGAFVGAPQGWRESSVLAFLVSPSLVTKGVREALHRSRWPMGYVRCTKEGKILQMLWNRRAAEEGLEGIEVGLRYDGEYSKGSEVILTWKGDVFNE